MITEGSLRKKSCPTIFMHPKVRGCIAFAMVVLSLIVPFVTLYGKFLKILYAKVPDKIAHSKNVDPDQTKGAV